MNKFDIRFLESDEMDAIVPFAQLLNPDTSAEILRKRLEEMKQLPSYKCLGIFDIDKLIAICGIWEMTKFYSGKQLELDNFIILPEYRSQGLGKTIMNWIYDYAISTGCESCELNTYVGTPKTHKFYYNEGFIFKGMHMTKDL